MRIYRLLFILIGALILVGLLNTKALSYTLRWLDSDFPLTYYINDSNSGIPDDSELTAIQNAFQTWEDVATASVSFTYGGITDRGFGLNYHNDLLWADLDNSSYIALATVWYQPVTSDLGIITECDIRFNTYYNWGTTGASDLMDVQNIATHETGHFLGLPDYYDSQYSEMTMYGYSWYGETKKRDLTSLDIELISNLYPSSEGSTESPAEFPTAAVPEPGTLMLLGSGLVGLFGISRRIF